MLATIPDTENGSTGSVSVSQDANAEECQTTPVRLTRDEMWSLWRAMRDYLPAHVEETPTRTAWRKLNDALEL